MINDALENLDNWVTTGLNSSYKRRKNYNYNYGPLQLHEVDMPKEHRNFMENIAKLLAKWFGRAKFYEQQTSIMEILLS